MPPGLALAFSKEGILWIIELLPAPPKRNAFHPRDFINRKKTDPIQRPSKFTTESQKLLTYVRDQGNQHLI